MFDTFVGDEDYTLGAIIEELQEERNDTMLIEAAMPYRRYAAKLSEIIAALERLRAQLLELSVRFSRVKQNGGAQ